MAVADRYEGEPAGACGGCGSLLVWAMVPSGWCVVHADAAKAQECSSASSAPVVAA